MSKKNYLVFHKDGYLEHIKANKNHGELYSSPTQKKPEAIIKNKGHGYACVVGGTKFDFKYHELEYLLTIYAAMRISRGELPTKLFELVKAQDFSGTKI